MSTKTPAEMSKFLASPDVAVTNKKDKVTMLPIVGKTDEHVREMMSGMHSVIPESHEAELREDDNHADAARTPKAPAPQPPPLQPPVAPLVMERESHTGKPPASKPPPQPGAARSSRAPARDPRGGNEYWDYFCVAFLATLCHFLCHFLCGCCRQFRHRMQVEQAIRKDQAAPKKVEQAIEELRWHSDERWADDAPFFYFIPRKVVLDCRTRSLPPMQTLRNVGHLKKIRIPLGDAFHGVGIINHILFVSHRWEEPSRPDVDGVQLEAIKMYLEAHPDIKWVWFDYSSMPQSNYGIDDRTPMEKAEFQLMLSAITDLNLTAHVLILIDGSYASRFWTLFEAWCSMQTVTPEGLRPATEAERRYTIECIHNATDEYDAKGLVDKVSTKTPDEMYRILEKPDVNVTNAKDKEIMLPIIQKTNDKVIETFHSWEPKPEKTMLPQDPGDPRRQPRAL